MRVVVDFDGSKITPLFFWRGNRRYGVKTVSIRFKRKDADRNFLCFGVDTGTSVAELRLDLKEMCFSLHGFDSVDQ